MGLVGVMGLVGDMGLVGEMGLVGVAGAVSGMAAACRGHDGARPARRVGLAGRVLPHLAALLLLLPLAGGCATFEAARLYKSGTEALDEGDVDRALEDLGRAVELAPEASEVHNHLGLALAADGREGAALLEFQRAVELDCENDAAQTNLAVTRMRLGIQVEERQRDVGSIGEER